VGLHQCPSEKKSQEAPVRSRHGPSHVPHARADRREGSGLFAYSPGIHCRDRLLLEGDGFEPSVPRVMDGDLGRQVPALIAFFEQVQSRERPFVSAPAISRRSQPDPRACGRSRRRACRSKRPVAAMPWRRSSWAGCFKGKSVPEALAATIAAIYSVIEATMRSGSGELALVTAQDEPVSPSRPILPQQL
jgi:hypothetical protein